jgi:hypothetical protein
MSRPGFRTWLRRFRHDETAIGDLARDTLADPDWPRGPGSLARYEGRLEDAGACDGAVRALREAWARYEQERRGA